MGAPPPGEGAEKKVVVVQGGTSGIGLAAAARLLADGYRVLLSSRREANVASALAALAHPDASGLAGHAASAADRSALVGAATALRADGQVHGLVLSAAASTAFGPLLETGEAAFAKMLHVNVLAGFLTLREFEACGALDAGASVVFVSSIGAYAPLPALGAYSVTKTALLALSRALAVELGTRDAPKRSVRVNCVAPGIIRTKFSERLWRPLEADGRGGATARDMQIEVPMQRLGTPEDVAGCISFLIRDDSGYVTGECIVPAGGMRSRL
jgi:dehydrogenase/reductase SDR family member 4